MRRNSVSEVSLALIVILFMIVVPLPPATIFPLALLECTLEPAGRFTNYYNEGEYYWQTIHP